MKKLLILFFCILSVNIKSQTVISGKEPNYAGEQMQFYSITDPVSKAEKEIAKFTLEKDGSFSTTFAISKITLAYLRLGTFKGEIFLEPNRSYHIVFPEKKAKTDADKLNPFFKETSIYLKIIQADSSELNYKTEAFNDFYTDYLSLNSFDISKKGKKSNVDTAIVMIDSLFPVKSHPFFEEITNYRKANLRYYAYERNEKFALTKYFANQFISFQNPAYVDLFLDVSSKFLANEFTNNKLTGLNVYLSDQKSYHASFQYLKKTLKANNDEFIDLMLLKCLNDGFYAEWFDHVSAWTVLDSIQQQSKFEETKEIAAFLLKKTHLLQVGSQAPNFELVDLNGKHFELKSPKTKFIYLQFYSSKSFSSQEDLQILHAFNEKYAKEFEVITIICDNDFSALRQRITDRKYKWKFLFLNDQQNTLKNYNVTSFPTYYLISPDGKLVMSPAIAPKEEIVDRFGKIYLDYKNKKTREEAKKLGK